ncbi:hypothetical protein MYP_2416 [Sporocytophaga myxococcoides]|uniref:Uncharacterized protein n=1 Tax=Sporocytophaga myxococcoides TaxID=153721 RepID=A0A098LFC2_9BACT|nr:hypothetical protein MYP_2416 [Sporocytophaga myxococcoides]
MVKFIVYLCIVNIPPDCLEKILKHKVLPLLILISILFTQVAVNYFHHHNEDSSKELSIEVAKEKCKVCSIDLYHDVFYQDIHTLSFQHKYFDIKGNFIIIYFDKITFFKSGRAPPSC